MKRDSFSDCHPIVNFAFFLGAIGFGVVINHPMYLLLSCAGAISYYLLLMGRNGLKTILGLLPLVILIAVFNPLINTYGYTVLFQIFGRNYTLEAMYYGLAIGGMFFSMMIWFSCYSQVLTSDKFTALFGNLIPALSLLLVMVLRMIPSFTRKAKQITGARAAIGKGVSETDSVKEKAVSGLWILSSLTDWALESSVTTADSMRSRGYGTSKRVSFHLYHMTVRDWILLLLILILVLCVLFFSETMVYYTPRFWCYPVGLEFIPYCLFVFIPTLLRIQEAIVWHNMKSKI